MKMHVVKGGGFNSHGDGFSVIYIDGKKYDAQCIAAFPDLLAAAKAFDDVVNEPNGHEGGWEMALTRASDNLRAAIAKAEGKS